MFPEYCMKMLKGNWTERRVHIAPLPFRPANGNIFSNDYEAILLSDVKFGHAEDCQTFAIHSSASFFFLSQLSQQAESQYEKWTVRFECLKHNNYNESRRFSFTSPIYQQLKGWWFYMCCKFTYVIEYGLSFSWQVTRNEALWVTRGWGRGEEVLFHK